MSLQSNFILSFYEDIGPLDGKSHIQLVRHVETGKIFVKKVLTTYEKSIYETLHDMNFQYIPKIKELISLDDKLIVIEEYINGQSISEILETRVFSESEAKNIILQLCQILEPLHASNPSIIHRDIKPSNIIVDSSNRAYLIDFNASKVVSPDKCRDTVLIGTTDYAAPEQFGFLQSDNRTDIYAMGVLLNKMLNCSLPSENLYKGDLSKVILKCIALDPKMRYSCVQDLSKSIKRGESSWTLPGFRTHKWYKMLIASFGYFILFYSFFTSELTTNNIPLVGSQLWLNKAFLLISFLVLILFLSDYKGIANKITPYKSASKFLRIFFRILIALGILTALMTILAILEAIIY